jgi:hypothetical protein
MHKTFYFKFIIIDMKRIRDLQIMPISNTRFLFILYIASLRILLQGSVMEQPIYRHRPRLSMTQSVIN